MPNLTTRAVSDATKTLPVDLMIFGWWNTSLSPVGRDRADDNHKQISARIVKSLIDELNFDCLALGEITTADLSMMKSGCETQALAVFDGTLKTGRLQFDTGVIYNDSRLRILNSKSITSSHGHRNYKIANRIDFECISDGSHFHLFVSHWPSRGVREENILMRETIADRLKAQIRAIEEIAADAAIIVVGDFNDEPFDQSLAWNMLATRDRGLAKTKTGYLYNPFWRRLGESKPHTSLDTKGGAAGSCFYRTETSTRWRTFDQMLFSSAFLGKGEWHLNEDQTTILESDFLIELVQSDDVHFDHLPVLSVVERFAKQNGDD